MLPSEITKLPTEPPVKGFPTVWKFLLLHDHDRSLSLTHFSLFLSFIFCPTYFWREWGAFLGIWYPLPVFRSCFVEVAQHSNDLLMNFGGRKWSPHPIPPPSWSSKQEYTELYKKDLHDPDNHDGVITHLEPDILECEVKWALGSITMNKASGGDGILVELFQILKEDTVKVLHSICQQIWKTQQWPQDWKRSVFTPIPKKGNAKECSNYCTIALISHAGKVMCKILQARFQQYMNRELPDVQADFRKGRGTRDQIVNICWIIKKAREFHKNI